MARRLEAGKAKALLAIILVGVVAVGGTLIIVLTSTDPELPDDPGATKADRASPNIISEIDDPVAAGEKDSAGEEEEKPLQIRTVDEMGNPTWIDTRQVDIYRPGKGTIKAMKIASATGRKMKPMETQPEPAKTVSVHPSQIRKGKGKLDVRGKPGGDTGAGDDKETDTGKDKGKMGEGEGGSGGGGGG